IDARLQIEASRISEQNAKNLTSPLPKVDVPEALRESFEHFLAQRARGPVSTAVPSTSPDKQQSAYRVRLRGPLRPAWLDGLQKTGAIVSTVLANDVYRMLLTPAQAIAVRALDFASAVE